MILGAEIGMIIWGLMALATGKMTLTKTKILTGPLARQLGFLLLAPIPVAYLAHGFLHAHFVQQRKPIGGKGSEFFWTMTAIEGAIVVACLAIVYVVAWVNATDPAAEVQEKDALAGESPPHGGLWN